MPMKQNSLLDSLLSAGCHLTTKYQVLEFEVIQTPLLIVSTAWLLGNFFCHLDITSAKSSPLNVLCETPSIFIVNNPLTSLLNSICPFVRSNPPKWPRVALIHFMDKSHGNRIYLLSRWFVRQNEAYNALRHLLPRWLLSLFDKRNVASHGHDVVCDTIINEYYLPTKISLLSHCMCIFMTPSFTDSNSMTALPSPCLLWQDNHVR